MIFDIIIIVLGNLAFLYLFWKKLHDDYTADEIFSSAYYIILFITLFVVFFLRFAPQFWFWGSVLGIALGSLYSHKKNNLRSMELVESLVISLLPGLLLIYLLNYIRLREISSLFFVIVISFLIGVYRLLNKHYKKFSWYKSGKVGLSGLLVLGIFFLIRSAVAISFVFVLSFAGKYEVYFSGISAFFFFLAVFHLARRAN